MGAVGRTLAGVAVIAGLLLTPVGASAQAPPPVGGPVQPYGANDAGGFRNVLPPGSNGLANFEDFVRLQMDPNDKPRHSDDQLPLYDGLVFDSPEVGRGGIDDFFKDGTFGIRPGDVESPTDNLTKNQNPCPGATTLRDKQFGVPRVYASTREAAMCALGYVAAEDRLFLIDVLRNAGRAQLTTFIGGAEANRTMDEEQWRIAPYTEADLRKQVLQLPKLYGEEGEQIVEDSEAYVTGINKYIAEAYANRTKMPVEYAAINRPGPEPWKDTDLVATASLVGGIFGKGGGRELDAAVMLQEMQKRFEDGGASRETQEGEGREVFDDFRRAEDEEAPTTTEEAFPYQEPPGEDHKKNSSGVPDPGTVDKAETSAIVLACQPSQQNCSPTPEPGEPGDPPVILPNLQGALSGFPSGASNALLVSGSETNSGRPQAVFGPQTGYFSPQILMEQEVHAPTLEARGAAFPGVNLYVQLGRGPDYAWSATSAGQDIVDTYAVELCGGKDSNRYRFRGRCEIMEELVKENVFNTNVSDDTVGKQTLRTQRTKLGLVVGRGEIDGEAVAYTQLRSTYFHEIDSARGFSDFNDPGEIRDLGDYQRAASKIGYTFNWFYADSKEIGYFNSGNNPERPEGIDHNFPVRGLERYEWRGYDPEDNTANYTPFDEHPQAEDPSFLTSWNNKQAPEHRAADDNLSYGSVHRSEPLDDRIEEQIGDGGEMRLDRLVDAMEDAATVDLRGDKVLPWALRVIGNNPPDEIADDVEKLRDWEDDGAHRRDKDDDGEYEHSDAVALMDAWWPELVKEQFDPTLGGAAFDAVKGLIAIDNPPNTHQGSAYIAGWYSFVEKDLRSVLEAGEGERTAADEGEDQSGDEEGEQSGPGEQEGDGEGADDEKTASAAEPEGADGEREPDGSGATKDEITAQDEPEAGDEGEPDVEDPYSRIYCGGTEDEEGDLKSCREVLVESLDRANDRSKDDLYGEDPVCDEAEPDQRPEDDQICFDAILFTAAGAVEQPLINWQNRPTFQQVVEVLGRVDRDRVRDRDDDGSGDGGDSRGGEGGDRGNNGFELFPPGLTRPPACLPAAPALGRLGLGPIRLAASPLDALLGAGLPTGSPRSTFRYCLAGGGELLVAFSSAGRARLIASSSSESEVKGIGPGDRRSALLRAFPRAVALGPGLYRASPSSRLVFGLERARVRFLGIADRGLLADRRALADHLERLGF